jgi:hypothetical protein
MERIKVCLTPQEYTGLVRLAEADLRGPAEQLRHLLRSELARHDLLKSAQMQAQGAGDGEH